MSAPIIPDHAAISSGTLSGGTFNKTIVLDATSPETLVLPNGKFASDAEYLQQGDDLLMIGADGATVVVRDYFLTDTPPDLLTPEGGRVTPEIVSAFTPPEAVGQYAQMGESNAAPVGQAVNTVGQVFAVRANGVREAIGAGDPIYQGDVIETADGGAVDVLFVDKTTFALAGDARLAIDKLVFDADTKEGSSSFSILKGMFVFSSGEIAKINPLDMTVNTTVATIGIRGTKVAGEVNPAGEESKFTILEGEIVVVTDAGYVVLSDANETSFVSGFNAPPSEAVLFSDSEISGFYKSVESISNNYYKAGSAKGNGGDSEKGAVGGQNEENTPENSGDAEGAGNDDDLEKQAEAMSDIAPASGGEVEAAEEDTFEGTDTVLAKSFNYDGFSLGQGGFEAGALTIETTQVGNNPAKAYSNENNAENTSENTGGNSIAGPTSGDDSLMGSGGDDTINGGGGNDTIDGGDGDDRLIGEDGDDIIMGGNGDDFLVAATGAGDDQYDGGADIDTISFSSAIDSVTVNLEQGMAVGVDIDTDSISAVENVIGGAGDDVIIGDALDNILSGAAGNDTIRGGAGADTLDGDAGNDTLDGGEGDDLLRGGAGDDEYRAASEQGTDLIEDSDGAADSLVLTGSASNLAEFGGTSRDGDDLIIALDDGDITIADHFGAGTVETITFESPEDGSQSFTLATGLTGNNANGIVSGSDADETLNGGGGRDLVFAQGGDDTGIVMFDGSNDHYDGGTGNDTLVVNLTASDLDNPEVVADLLALRDFIADNANAATSEGPVGRFAALGLEAANWENIEILVDGETADLDVAQPEIVVAPAVGDENSDIELDIAAALADNDGSELLSVTVSGLPSGASLSAGNLNQDGSVTLSPAQLPGLTLTPAPESSGDFTLGVTATATESSTGLTATTTVTLPVSVIAVMEAPEISSLTPQSAQTEPVVAEHTLSTDSATSGVTMSDLELARDHPVSVTFLGESAGYRNTIGYYKISDDGTMSDVKLIWENASAIRSGGDLVPGSTSVDLEAAAGEQLAFFIVANGDRNNNFDNFTDGAYVFRDGEGLATVNSEEPALFFVAADGTEHAVTGPIYHTTEHDGANQLNSDGLVHTVSNIDPATGGLTIGFEDLLNQGDKDFNDLNIRVDFGPAISETLAPTLVAPDIALSDADGETLSAATVEIVSGLSAGDALQVGSLEEHGITVTEQGLDETAGVYRLVLSGEASLEDYEAVLGTVALTNGSDAVTFGVREVAISVTDADGMESQIATASVAVQSMNSIAGGADADLLTGSAGNDIIDGNGGDDVIIGAGGKDVLRGGEGDDRLIAGDDDFALIDGGAGTDTVAVDFDLDLSAVADNAISGIESFDLGGGSEAALSLGVDDVLAVTSGVNALTESENTLVIRRDADDDVTIVGDEWETSVETLDGDNEQLGESYTVYHDNASGATVYVENNINFA
jgi:Ca2+-binding RTX toxin-like protein